MFKPIKVNILSDKINFRSLIPFAEVLSKLIAFINILLMMRVLPLTEYAEYSYIVVIVMWAAFLMDGGINNLIFNKSLKNDTDEINVLYSSRFVLSIIIILGLLLFFIFRKPTLVFSGFIFSIVLYLNTSSALIKMFSRGKRYFKVDLFTVLSETILRLVVFAIIYFAFPNLEWKLWMFMLIYLIAGLFSFSLNYKLLANYFRLKIKLGSFKKMYRQVNDTLGISKFFLLVSLFHSINMKLEIIFIEKYASKTNLALFSSALTLSDVILLFFFAIITSHFIKIYQSSKTALLYTFVASAIIISVTQFISVYIFKILFPIEYTGSVEVINHLIFGIFPSVVVYYFIIKLNYENKTHINFILLFIPILIKIAIYNYSKSSDLTFYMYLYPMMEYAVLFCYVLYFAFFNGNKKTKSNELENSILPISNDTI